MKLFFLSLFFVISSGSAQAISRVGDWKVMAGTYTALTFTVKTSIISYDSSNDSYLLRTETQTSDGQSYSSDEVVYAGSVALTLPPRF